MSTFGHKQHSYFYNKEIALLPNQNDNAGFKRVSDGCPECQIRNNISCAC